MQFNEKLKSLRAKKGVSQAELAKSIFVSRSAVAKWENGLGLPCDESMKLLAKYFDITVDELKPNAVSEETVIQKNGLLSKQKIVIIILSVLFFAVAVLSAVFIALKITAQPETKDVIPLPSGRGLIFETEKDKTQFGDIKNYDDNELSENQQFSQSRTFVLSNDNLQIVLPKLVCETVSMETAAYVYESVNYNALTFFCTYGIRINCDGDKLYIGLTNPSVAELTGYANIRYGSQYVSIKIVKIPTSVESVDISFWSDDTQEIGLTESKSLSIDIKPYNATYDSFEYVIEKIEKADGSLYDGDLSKYASVVKDNGYILQTTKDIELGSKIYLYAETVKDKVRSNVMVVEVKRIPISHFAVSILGEDYYWASHLTAGDVVNMRISVFPENATANILGERLTFELETPENAIFEYNDNDWTITVKNEYPVTDKCIRVAVSAPEGYAGTFEWGIEPILIDEIKVINLETNAELEEEICLLRGSTLRLNTVVFPENATYGKISYNLYGASPNPTYVNYISISADGVLTVSQDAPFDMEVKLCVSVQGKGAEQGAGSVSSSVYKITVRSIPVQSVLIDCETYLLERETVYVVSIAYSPDNADIQKHEWECLDDVQGVYTSANRIYIDNTAVAGMKFRFVVYVYDHNGNRVESNILEFTIK